MEGAAQWACHAVGKLAKDNYLAFQMGKTSWHILASLVQVNFSTYFNLLLQYAFNFMSVNMNYFNIGRFYVSMSRKAMLWRIVYMP